MGVAVKYPHLTRNKAKGVVFEGHPRIRVQYVAAEHRYWGWTVETILENHPDLSRAAIHSALAYYFDHKEEMDRAMDEDGRVAQESRKQAKQPPRTELEKRLKLLTKK